MKQGLQRSARDWSRGFVTIELETWAVGPRYVFRFVHKGDRIFLDDIRDMDEAKSFARKLRLAQVDVREEKARW